MDHTGLLDMLRLRIDDRAFLRLMHKWLKAGIVDTDGQVVPPETGTPQGGTVTLPTNLACRQCLHPAA
jgi:retron-type reverse transcriptase